MKLIGLVVSLDHLQPAAVEDHEVIGHAIDKVAIVADEEHGAVEVQQRPFQGVAGPEVEVVGGFVEDEEIGVRGGQPGQRRPATLAAAEVAHPLQRRVAADAEAGQQVAALLVVELLVRRADGLQGGLLVVQGGQLLVEVTHRHALPQPGVAFLGRFQAQQARSSVVLPQPLGPSSPQRWPRRISTSTPPKSRRA